MALNQGLISLEIRPDGVAVAYNQKPSSSTITVCEFHEIQNTPDLDFHKLKELASKLTSKYHLKKTECNLVLHPDYYRLTLVDSPSVSKSEYKKAIRWQIKDIISYPLEDLAIDIFYPGETEENLKKIYVVAAQSSFLQKIVNAIQGCGLHPTSIDIHEFAARNLISKSSLANPNETIGFLSINNENCIIVLVKGNRVQFVRHFPINLSNLKNNDYNELVTELERSFNYCNTELKQELPKKILISPMLELDSKIAKDVGEKIQKETSIFNLEDAIDLKTSTDPQIESKCWIAIGGALRNII